MGVVAEPGSHVLHVAVRIGGAVGISATSISIAGIASTAPR